MPFLDSAGDFYTPHPYLCDGFHRVYCCEQVTICDIKRGVLMQKSKAIQSVFIRYCRGPIRIGLTCLFFLFMPFSSTLSLAMTSDPIMSQEDFKGIDTIVIEGVLSLVPKKLYPRYKKLSDPSLFVERAIKDIFSIRPHVIIAPTMGPNAVPVQDVDKSRIIRLNFGFSAREDFVNGKAVVIESLTLLIFKPLPEKKNTIMKTQENLTPASASYAFVLPDNDKEYEEKVRAGVHFLAGFLPFFFCKGKEADEYKCNWSDYYPYVEQSAY